MDTLILLIGIHKIHKISCMVGFLESCDIFYCTKHYIMESNQLDCNEASLITTFPTQLIFSKLWEVAWLLWHPWVSNFTKRDAVKQRFTLFLQIFENFITVYTKKSTRKAKIFVNILKQHLRRAAVNHKELENVK